MHKKLLLPTVFAVLTILLFVGGPDYYSNRIYASIWDLGHIALFFLLVILLFKLKFISDRKLQAQIGLTLAIVIFFAVSIEVVQIFTHRTPELADIRRDLLGALAGFTFVLNQKKVFHQLLAINIFPILLVIMLGWGIFELQPLFRSIVDELEISQDGPVLSTLEGSFEEERWEGNSEFYITEDFSSEGRHSLEIKLNTDEYSGVFLRHMHRDWRQYEYLNFSVYYPYSDSLKLNVRINDYSHLEHSSYTDRYNSEQTIQKGWNHIRIALDDVLNAPANRAMNLAEIESFGIFVINLTEGRTIYLDNAYLY